MLIYFEDFTDGGWASTMRQISYKSQKKTLCYSQMFRPTSYTQSVLNFKHGSLISNIQNKSKENNILKTLPGTCKLAKKLRGQTCKHHQTSKSINMQTHIKRHSSYFFIKIIYSKSDQESFCLPVSSNCSNRHGDYACHRLSCSCKRRSLQSKQCWDKAEEVGRLWWMKEEHQAWQEPTTLDLSLRFDFELSCWP